MNAPFHPLRTAANLLAMLEHADLPPVRRRDLASAINRICKMSGCHPDALKLDVPGLRAKLSAIRPAAHGIGKSTFSNIRSLFTAGMELAGVIACYPHSAAKHHPDWAPLVAAIAGNERLSSGLITFMNWCAWTGVTPASVDDGTVKGFLHWMETGTLRPRPRNLVWQLPKLWAEGRELVPAWPATELSRISFRPPSPNLRWDALPEGLRVDAESYLSARANPDLFDDNPDAPTRPLAPRSIAGQREHIRLAASVLVRHGVSLSALDSLAAIVAVDAVKEVLRHYHTLAAGKPSTSAVGTARTLIHIARYHVKVPEQHLNELRWITRQLPAIPFDLTQKNKTLLTELENESNRARLLRLPETLMREVKSELAKGRRLKVASAQISVAIDLLLVAPLRPKNLCQLNWRLNFKEPEGPKGKLIIYIPKDTTKTQRRDLIFEVPAELAETIRWYRRDILPRLGGDPNGAVFVTKNGERKSQETLSQQLTEIIEEKVGVHMTPHQFRHLAAVLYLEAHPEDFQTVSDLLGHSFTKTTLIYAGSSSRRASRAYGKLVIEQRETAALRQRRPRRRRA